MSSNAFARSRPRVRHQRVPKTQSYVHPRFLQLVKELARLDEIKKKRDELEHPDESPSGPSSHNASRGGTTSTARVPNDESPSDVSVNLQHPVQHPRPQHHHHHHHHHHHQHQSQHSQRAAIDCWPISTSLGGSNCCGSLNDAHPSNGCRSLECNQSSLALNDTYYRQNSSNDNPQIANHGIQHQQHYHHQHHHHSYPSNHHQNPIDNSSGNNGHGQNSQQDYRCLNKCSSSSTATPATNINFGYSKTTLIVQNDAEFLGNEPDLRQDENRSKRKRSSNDSSSMGKKISPSLSPTSCSKRHKSSPEPARPLSPSFTKCPICLLDCMDRDPSFTNTCFHLFCFVCIENWSKSKATCPLCRTKFTKIIYNIRSASCFDEKVASPIRRDDDDDRIIYEQLHGLNANALGGSTRTPDEARLLFDNLRHSHNDVLMPHFALLNHSFNRHVSALQSFNSVTTNSNFNSSVPHTHAFTAANYNPVPGSDYIALLPSNERPQGAASGPAISSAYATNTSLNIIHSDSSNRAPRMSRSGRFIYSRNNDLTPIDGTTRISRSTSTDLNQTAISLQPRHHHHHHHQMQHNSHHQHHGGQHNQPPQQQQHNRATVATIELGPSRQGQRVEAHSHIIPYLIPPRQYTNPNVYSRRTYTNPPADQHILDNLYRQMPDI